jgi:hypothetical protein
MSIAAMSDAKLMGREPEKREANGVEKALGLEGLVERTPPDRARATEPPKVPPTVTGQLVRWIPTESITLYVAFIALLSAPTAPAGGEICEAGFTGRWIAVGAFALGTVLLAFLVHVGKVRRTAEPFRWPMWEMSVASIAFVAWALALPDTPLQAFCGYKIEIGAFIVLTTTVLITAAADALGRNVEAPEPTVEESRGSAA